MDPLSQGVLGASAPQSFSRGKDLGAAGLLGFFAGMAADLDVLIRSNTDPLLFLEYHRQFTHSLVFIPFGGMICGLVLHYLLGKRRGLSLGQSCLYCTLGYATHALLDACTTYGTQLLWPFSDARFAWNAVSIIDPLFTFPLLALVMLAATRKQALYGRIALLWAITYMLIGVVQRDRAVDYGHELALQRGHHPVRLEAKPSFANLLLWKIVYETEDKFFVDAVRVGFEKKTYVGDNLVKLDLARDMPWLDPTSQQARDVQRFHWFSNGYVALDPKHENRVIDIRYSLVPNEVDALWSIELSPSATSKQFVRYLVTREASLYRYQRFLDMLFDQL